MARRYSQRDRDAIKEATRRGMLRNKPKSWTAYCPHEPTERQSYALSLQHVFEILFGGAAGGGKSDWLLMEALQYIDYPEYAALLVRRTYKDLALPGAIMDRSHQWLANTDAHWNGMDKTWVFPSGARIAFGYLSGPQDKHRYQSMEIQMLGIDEATHLDEADATYLLSRLRRLEGSDVPLRARYASNPGGRGHRWVMKRFVESTDPSCVFVPSLLTDNPHIDQESYRESLSRLDEITRAQLERGEWIEDTQALVYSGYNEERNLVEELPGNHRTEWIHTLGIDYGASQATPTTAFSVWAFSPDFPAVYLVESTAHAGMTVSDIAEHYQALEQDYSFERIVGDQGGLGLGYNMELFERHGIPIENAQKTNKLGFRKLLNSDLRNGRAMVLDGMTESWQDEASTLRWNDEGTRSDGQSPDHCTDSALYGYREARHFMHEYAEPPPAPGSAAHYRKQESEYWERAARSIEHKETLGDLF